MEKSIKISVVIPVYNTAVFLSKCLESLHSQTYESVEYILVDDGSTDNSLDICRDYEKIDRRFVVISKENAGPSSARNLAISKARGEYITFVDSDDYLKDNAYERVAELLKLHSDPDCLIFGAELIPDNAPQYMVDLVSPRDIVYNKFEPDVMFKEVGSRPFLWLQVVKSSIIKDNSIVMDESIRLGEDQLFQMEFLPYAKKIVYVSDKLYCYRWKRAGSIMDLTAEKLSKKLLLHVDLVDKALSLMEKKDRGDEMIRQTLIWSIFFIWGDIVWLLEEEQSSVASALKKVWEKHDYKKYYETLDIWGKMRLNNILLMAEEDKDKRIENFAQSNKELSDKIEALSDTEEYSYVMRMYKNELTVREKIQKSIKEVGLFGTLKRIIKKILKKLLGK